MPYVIVGSGYGAAVAALRLAEAGAGADVLLLERGHEFLPGDFPADLANVPNHLRYQGADGSVGGSASGLYDMRFGDGVDALVGNGLGGGSLINANVAVQPVDAIFDDAAWPDAIRADARDGRLTAAFDAVRSWLGVAADPDLLTRGKGAALACLHGGLGSSIQPAPIAVTRGAPGATTTNRAGIDQPHCTDCGNCVSGCNVGAKNTLAMTLLPAAWRRGVRLVTGANVLYLGQLDEPGPAGERWWLEVQRTGDHGPERHRILAHHVILAAGTFGSTEILLRSQKFGFLGELSPRLGERFGTNGDAIAMSFAGRERTNALGTERFTQRHDCGPTISALLRGTDTEGRHYTIEDAAIPAPLTAFYGELITFAAQLGRLASTDLPAWFRERPATDPIAVHDGALRNSQTLLLMSEDSADGKLRLRAEVVSQDPAHYHVVPQFHGDAHLDALDAALQSLSYGDALAGAQYVANPLWRPLPSAASTLFAGDMGGRLLTVHPLGGCVMAERSDDGVVDVDGRVFRGNSGAVYDGLYVLDGSIVPRSLGTNPLLTIAALAWRACDALIAPLPASPPAQALRDLPRLSLPKLDDNRATDGALFVDRVPTEFVFRERLVGTLIDGAHITATALAALLDTSIDNASRLRERDGLVLDVRTLPADSDAFVNGSGPVRVQVALYCHPVTERRTRRQHAFGVDDLTLTRAVPLACGEGTLTALTRRVRRRGLLVGNTVSALRGYWRRRGSNIGSRRLNGAAVAGLVRVARMHAQHREFVYDFRLRTLESDRPLALRGIKRLAWHSGNPRTWTALTHLELRLAAGDKALRTRFVVDTEHMFGEGLLETHRAAHGPDVVAKALAVGGRFARSLLQTSFWEFGGADYPSDALPRNPHPRPLRVGNQTIAPEHVVTLQVERFLPQGSRHSPERVPLAITRYAHAEPRGHAVLIHGLAQGSAIYCHPAIGTPLATDLYANGYTVWLVDFRLSNRFADQPIRPDWHVPFDGWTMDEIGQLDMPAALREIRARAGEAVHVFAHCVGAVGMEIAIARGLLGTREVASLVVNAIHPWVRPAPANRVRAKLGVFFRDVLGNELFDPVLQPATEVDAAQGLLDRFAFSFGRLDEEPEDTAMHRVGQPLDRRIACAICDRMTFLYGRMWRHANLAQELHDHFADIVGRAPGAVFRHMYYMLTNHVVLDQDGAHSYMTDHNVRKHWAEIPTLFLHGEDSDVFNPQSATESAQRLFDLVDPMRDRSFREAVNVKLLRVPAYGHMDPIIGKRAVTDVFPRVRAFFEGERRVGAGYFDDIDDRIRTLAKPLPTRAQLRGARITADGNLALRYVGALPAIATPRFVQLALDHPSMPNQTEFTMPGTTHARFRVVDVKMQPDAYGPPRIASLLAHDPERPYREPIDDRRGFESGQKYHRAKEPEPTWLTRLRTRHAAGGAPLPTMHLVVGSCLYPGTPFDRNSAQRVFERIDAHANEELVDMLLFVGDWIYADATAGLMDPAPLYDRYTQRYEWAFASPAIERLLLRYPTHFAIDDHEITDNFAGPYDPDPATLPFGLDARLKRRLRALRTGIVERDQFDYARGVAVGFLGSGRNTRPFGTPWGQVGTSSPLWYVLDADSESQCPVFVADTRTERTTTGTTRQMFGASQLRALCEWLVAMQRLTPARPKFVVAGSVIAPVSADAIAFPELLAREDGFAGYPDEFRQLTETILANDVRGVVFISGDLHFSALADITLTGTDAQGATRTAQVLQVVASGLYAPLPFTNTPVRYYGWGIEAPAYVLQSPSVRACYRGEPLTDETLDPDGRSHFVKLDATECADGWQLRIRAISANGTTLKDKTRRL